MMAARWPMIGLTLALATAIVTPAVAADPDEDDVGRLARQVFYPDDALHDAALATLVERGRLDVVPALIQALRFSRQDERLEQALTALTGEPAMSWHDWILWQQAHPEIEPFADFAAFKADIMALIDPDFRLFLEGGINHEIRLEEIVWGGVVKDGIPALVNPKLLPGRQAHYLQDDELVFGVALNGDVRAYPFRILDWHEMFNDVVGGIPVVLAYCTLCGSGILYDTRVTGREEPLVFGSSGFLYRSNKLMYDQATHSLWNQFTGRPVVGPLVGAGIELEVLPVTIATWQAWQASHPNTKVLSIDTGYQRDYTPGRAYGDYFASPTLMFPALVPDDRLAPKAYVFAIRLGDQRKAWPLTRFEGGQVVHDRLGELDLVLIGDAATRTVRAYRADGRRFEATGDPATLRAAGDIWHLTEDALVGPDGARLARLAGHVAYWFAWQSFIEGAPLADASG